MLNVLKIWAWCFLFVVFASLLFRALEVPNNTIGGIMTIVSALIVVPYAFSKTVDLM